MMTLDDRHRLGFSQTRFKVIKRYLLPIEVSKKLKSKASFSHLQKVNGKLKSDAKFHFSLILSRCRAFKQNEFFIKIHLILKNDNMYIFLKLMPYIMQKYS